MAADHDERRAADGRTIPRVSVSLSDPEVIAALRGILAGSLGHWTDGDNIKRLALWSIYHRLTDAEKRLRAKQAALSDRSETP